MAVLAEMYSIVVWVKTLNGSYPGSVEAYEDNCPNRTFWWSRRALAGERAGLIWNVRPILE